MSRHHFAARLDAGSWLPVSPEYSVFPPTTSRRPVPFTRFAVIPTTEPRLRENTRHVCHLRRLHSPTCHGALNAAGPVRPSSRVALGEQARDGGYTLSVCPVMTSQPRQDNPPPPSPSRLNHSRTLPNKHPRGVHPTDKPPTNKTTTTPLKPPPCSPPPPPPSSSSPSPP